MTKIAVSQSNYIPWKGYFDLISSVDKFIIFDSVQYTRRDWRNRNRIFSTTGDLIWLTIPIKSKGNFKSKINQISVVNQEWRKNHFLNLYNSYRKTDHFNHFIPILEKLYLSESEINLTKINLAFIREICRLLRINTEIIVSSDYKSELNASEKIISECLCHGGKDYFSGSSAKSYLDQELFSKNNIKINWISYEGYPIYQQKSNKFCHQVSILDLIFNTGNNASNYMKS